MASHDPRIDAFSAKSAELALTILEHLRGTAHTACPDVKEPLPSSMPFFSYRGSPLCMMASFKQHCGFGFSLSRQIAGESTRDGMSQFGELSFLKDLPLRKDLATNLKQAMALSEAGVKLARPKVGAQPPPVLPEELTALLAQKTNATARNTYEVWTRHAARVSRLDQPSETRCQPSEAHCRRPDLARRRQGARLEIPQMLSNVR